MTSDQSVTGDEPDDLNRDLVEMERSFWDAAGDGGYYERNMASDGRCLLPTGILDRDATVAAIAESEPWADYELEDLVVHEIGLEGAVVGYRATASRGDDEPYRALVSTTYRRDGDRWELVVHQQTPLTPDG